MRSLALGIFLTIVSVGCSSKRESALTKALQGAVKEHKLTEKKMQRILTEFGQLQEEDKPTAREYADQVLSAIEMGGDSSHIDAARRQALKTKKIEIKV